MELPLPLPLTQRPAIHHHEAFRSLPMTPSLSPAIWLAMTLSLPLAALAAGDAPASRNTTVQFAKGQSSAQLRGTVKGDGDAPYTVDARAGQTLAVSLKGKNGSLIFNITPQGAQEAMFMGSVQGSTASVMLPADGHYVILVALMRNAARRKESAAYTLGVAVTGQALPPLPAAQDALVAGTRFHASATVPCQTLGAAPGASCQAGVIRRGRDGTGTVELRAANGLVRQVLFVKGQPVAADSAQPMTSSRQGDLITVRFGGDERYELPDALLTGG
jgi:hypothetical protein